jgi:hypothetical protein
MVPRWQSYYKYVHCTRDTLLIWKWAIIGHPFAPDGATFLPTHAHTAYMCVCVFAPFFPREIASNFKNGNSGVSHSVLLTLFSQSGSLLSRSRHAPFPRHAWAPLAKQRKEKPTKFPLIPFSFSSCVPQINTISLQVGYSLSTGKDESY